MFDCEGAGRRASKAFRFFCGLGLVGLSIVLNAAPAAAQPDAGSEPAACDTRDLLAGKAPFDQQNLTGELPRITDGTIDADGADWDAPTAVTMMGSGSVTYDLGAPTLVSSLFIQADA